MYIDLSAFDAKEVKSQKPILLQRRMWGLTATQNSRHIAFIETFLSVAGASLLFLSTVILVQLGALLMVADGFNPSAENLQELLALLTIAASGLALFYFSRIGIRKQLQVDLKIGEVRFGYLHRDRRFRQTHRISQSDIVSAFLFRSKKANIRSRLVIRLRNDPRPITVLKGTEEDLKPVLNEIIDMAGRNSECKIRRRTTNQLHHVKFG